jgi:hypothetical protein
MFMTAYSMAASYTDPVQKPSRGDSNASGRESLPAWLQPGFAPTRMPFPRMMAGHDAGVRAIAVFNFD